tara:strand:- start:64 stop:444 length:381 start_codon:yes stop_codon:yes gene_type:complete
MTANGWRQKCLNYPNIMFGRAVSNARNRALKKNIPFDLTRDDVMKMFDDQDGRCYYSGLKLNVVKADASRTHDPFKMSLDCVDPNLGYVKGNVVWCAYCVNALKLKMSEDSMIAVCRAIVKKADSL